MEKDIQKLGMILLVAIALALFVGAIYQVTHKPTSTTNNYIQDSSSILSAINGIKKDTQDTQLFLASTPSVCPEQTSTASIANGLIAYSTSKTDKLYDQVCDVDGCVVG